MTTTISKSTIKNIALAGASSLLIACGGSGSSSDGESANFSNDSETILTGSAVKGVVENGIVRAYLVENIGGVARRSATPIGTAVRTDVDGNYTITLPASVDSASVIVELTADNMTRMICDVTDGCGTDEGGNPIVFGARFTLDPDFVLSAAVTNVSAGTQISAHMTPLSHMAIAYAEANASGLTTGAIENAYSYIETLMELDAGTLTLTPPNLADLEAYVSLSESQLELSVLSASFQALANTADWETVADVIEAAAQSMATAGQLSANSTEDQEVSLEEIFLEATEIAVDLAEDESGSEYASVLANVGAEVYESYEAVAGTDQGGNDEGETGGEQEPEFVEVVITQQPGSANVDAGESVLLSVAAQGGSLSYQWRKDGQNIAGATSSSLNIASAQSSDAGAYTVVVTNAYESESSLVALVNVAEVVVEPVFATLDIEWDVPAERQDGSSLDLSDIEGYVIQYGEDQNNLDQTVEVGGASSTSHTLSDMTAATYYFRIATVDIDGVQGQFSNLVSIEVL